MHYYILINRGLSPIDSGGVAVVRAGGVASGVAISTNAEASNSGLFGITIGDIGNFVIDLITPGGISDLGAGSDIRPNASGGFVLYPNKPNTNMLQKVYSKK